MKQRRAPSLSVMYKLLGLQRPRPQYQHPSRLLGKGTPFQSLNARGPNMSIYGTIYSRHTRHRGSIQVSRLLGQTMIILMCTTFVTVDELRKFMEISQLQNPRTRSKTKVLPEVRPSNTVKEEDDGSVTITKVEIKPTSSGREIWKLHKELG